MQVLCRLSFLVLVLLTSTAFARNVAEYNLSAGVGLKAFDPVAIFPEGGGRPVAGLPEHRLVVAGVTYYFASEANLALFERNPQKYEPTYGGYCAWAMSYGAKVDIRPEIYTLHGNRAHYFASRFAKFRFDGNVPKNEASADANWRRFSGEEPRF